MSVAERTRAAVDERPVLRDALAAGVVNYAAAAETLAVDAGTDAVATALRRYADELPASGEPAAATVRLERGVGTADADSAVLTVGDETYRTNGGSHAAVTVAGEAVDARTLERVLGRLRTADVSVTAAAVGESLVVIVPGRQAAAAVRASESVVR